GKAHVSVRRVMNLPFAIIAVVTIAAGVAAMSLRNLVHCALSLTVAFAGLAAAYLLLGAQFVGFSQILVYIGAVAILIVFAILLTRSSEPQQQPIVSGSWLGGIAVAVVVFGLLAGIIFRSDVLHRKLPATIPEFGVADLGQQLMTRYILPLEVLGLL